MESPLTGVVCMASVLPWCDFEQGTPLDPDSIVQCHGLPVLVPDAAAFLARHGPRPAGHPLSLVQLPEPLPVDAPDPLTPHIPPGRWPDALVPPGAFGAWVQSLGDTCPDAVCADWGAELAPDGPAVDAGCGVGGMARRMAVAGRRVVAFDRAPAAVMLARELLLGAHRRLVVPGARSTALELEWPHGPVAADQVQWAVADVLAPPLPTDSVAWIHLGSVVDMVAGSPLDVIDALAPLLQTGGLLTVATPHDDDAVPTPNAPDPSRALRRVLDALGFHVVAEERAVPWVVRQYDRGYRVLLTDCLAARASW